MKTMRETQTATSRSACATCKRNEPRQEYEVGRDMNCDAAEPNCTNCTRSKRTCQRNGDGGGLKLSWPRTNDTRRSVVSKYSPPSSSFQTRPISDASFVHTSSWDFELYHSLINSRPDVMSGLTRMRVPLPWTPLVLQESHRELLEYCMPRPCKDRSLIFECLFIFFGENLLTYYSTPSIVCHVASAALATFGYDATVLGASLVRIALSRETPSATAVLDALLAFSSLHRYGLQPQAAKLKISALKALARASTAPRLGPRETVEHTATGMLLCSFEVHISSCSSDEWMAYLAGVETVICAANIDELLELDPDAVILLDWVRYFDVLARFSLLYWERDGTPELPSTLPDIFSSHEISCLPPPISSMLSLLSQTCDTISRSSSSSSSVNPPHNSTSLADHKAFLRVLDFRIRSLPISPASSNIDIVDLTHILVEQILITHLYQLALLLLLHRSSNNLLLEKPAKTQHLISRAFSLLARLTFCKQQFPIHVIGRILEAVWAQDDLREGEGKGLEYTDKLTWVFSHCAIVPAFV
ncbi:zinc-finger transcription factor [Pyrenophora seminiperda CCB06]|uniref:Zinc-finger transcription factor n=1 Tax=Pyrenophora seminiperda CCB06 TaxID=1302712 RepID=A0A3M7M2H6_9PLEO|nr:zinc-finger transcription factor [Pyrenophora seminiperda CCB06]